MQNVVIYHCRIPLRKWRIMTRKRKTLQELTIKDNFMFGMVMSEEENCRSFLELALGIPIRGVKVDREKSMIYHPEYKGIRLDVFAKDEKNTCYNVEMQVRRVDAPGKRSRYYHSQMAMEMIKTGNLYTELADSIVIFICDFDPFGDGRYRYTFQSFEMEKGQTLLEDGCKTIFFSTKGKNDEEERPSLVKFLKYVGADLEFSKKDFQDELVTQFQNSVRQIKASREMEGRYMILEEMLREERMDGKIQGIAEAVLSILEELGRIPAELTEKIEAEDDLNILHQYLKQAINTDSIEDFRIKTGL